RPLKRAIERHLVFPLSNLIATRQIALGDFITIDYSPPDNRLTFVKEQQGALFAPAGEEVMAGQLASSPTSRGAAASSTALVLQSAARE
ncbi:MAG TPA: ATP-dependent Clp protease ATP-binding subunit, partial [Terriglobia bacterium]|nr:ATP-dependent Clp protease ATP-binding subunit [Terriglobia bacterium]